MLLDSGQFVSSPLADLGDILGGLVPLVFFVIWVLSQVVGEKQQPAAQKGPKRLQPPGQAPPKPQDFNEEIDAFLKRAATKRGDQPIEDVEVLEARRPPARPRQPLPSRAEPLEVDLAHARQVEQRPRKTLHVEPIEPQIVEADIEIGGNVADHVQKHLGSNELAQHAEHLAYEMSQTDERVEERIHQRFDHLVGHLAESDLAAQSPYESSSKQAADAQKHPIAAMLGDKDKVRQAIVLSEIFGRPGGIGS